MCHFIDRKADLSSALPLIDAFHLSLEVIRGDRQYLKSNFLWGVLCLSYLFVKFYPKSYYVFLFLRQ